MLLFNGFTYQKLPELTISMIHCNDESDRSMQHWPAQEDNAAASSPNAVKTELWEMASLSERLYGLKRSSLITLLNSVLHFRASKRHIG
jgi:hypothetical protein